MGKPWQKILRERCIPINDQYFLIYCETKEKMYCFSKKLKDEYEFEHINAYSMGLLLG